VKERRRIYDAEIGILHGWDWHSACGVEKATKATTRSKVQLHACLHTDPSVNLGLGHWFGNGRCRCQEGQAGNGKNDDHFGVHFDDNAMYVGDSGVKWRSCEALCAFARVGMGRTIEVDCYG